MILCYWPWVYTIIMPFPWFYYYCSYYFFKAIFDNVFVVVVVLFSRPFFQICSLERRFQIMTTANCKLLSKNVCSRKVARYRFHSLWTQYIYRGRFSSVGRALYCRAGGRGFDSWDRTNTQGLKITEKWRFFFVLQTARPSRGSDDHVKWRIRLH